MKLLDLTCPHCGAHLNVDADVQSARCEHCGATFLIDDEARRLQSDPAGEAGKPAQRRDAGAEDARASAVPPRLFSFHFTTRNLTALGLLLALEIVLSRFLSIATWDIKIGFSFVPIVVAAVVFGPLPAATLAALGDFLGANLFPIGPYFPGFTFTAFLTGLVFGLFLYRRRSMLLAAAAVLLTQFGLSLLLNSLWISILYHSPYLPLMAGRVGQAAVLTVVELIVIWAITRNCKLLSFLKDR